MNICSINKIFKCLFSTGAGLYILFNTAFAQDQLAVVINGEAKVTELKMQELKTVLKGEQQRWKDGSKVMIALMKTSSSVGSTISQRVYGMSGDALNKFWLALVFQGKATAPVFFESENDLKAYVAKTKGAIGVISAATLQSEKSILIDGKKSF